MADAPLVPLAGAQVETVVGYIRTQIDCPWCSDVFDVEGDVSGETLQCDLCGGYVYVEHVM